MSLKTNNGSSNNNLNADKMPSVDMNSPYCRGEMPNGEMSSSQLEDSKLHVLVELRTSNSQRNLQTLSSAVAGSVTSFQLDLNYEPIPVNPSNRFAANIGSEDEETILVRGAIDEHQIRELEAQPNVVKVYKDTPIAPFDPTSTLVKKPARDLVEPVSNTNNCPIGTCDCAATQAKGTIADVAKYLGIDKIWARGYKGEGIVVGIVDGGITAEGRSVGHGETERRIPNVIGGPDSDWGTKARSWGEHGNMCATDVLGMAPEAKLYDCRLAGGDAISNALRVFEWAIKQHKTDGTPQILTNSWGIYQKNWDEFYATNPDHPFTRKVVEAIEEGILVLFAAGNCGGSCPSDRCGQDFGSGKSIWGANGHPRVITVGAVNKHEEFVGYSSQGPAALDENKPDFCSITHFQGYFDCDNGTSAATPIAAGAVALLKQAKPSLTQAQIKDAFKSTAKNIGEAGFDQHSGAGIIQPLVALEKILPEQPKCSKPVRLGGTCFSAAGAASWGTNRLDTFVLSADSSVHHKYWDGKTWSDWLKVDGFSLSAPAVIAPEENNLNLFVIGQKRQLLHKQWSDCKWGEWEDLGGLCKNGVAVSAWGCERLDIFTVAADNALWYKYWNGDTWSKWQSLGGFCLGAPTAVATAQNRIDVFVRGHDHSIYQKSWNGSTWSSNWQNLGGLWLHSPSVTSSSENHLDLFAVGTDNTLHRKFWNGLTWSPWKSIGDDIAIAAPSAVSSGDNHINIFVVGCDNALYHKSFA